MACCSRSVQRILVCAAVSGAAVATVLWSASFSRVAGLVDDGGLGIASSPAADFEDSRRLLEPAWTGPDHTLPLPSKAPCRGSQSLAPTLFIIGFPHSGARSLGKWMNMHGELSHGRVAVHSYYCIPTRDHVVSGRAYTDGFKAGCGVKQTFDATPYAYQMAFGNSTQCHFRGQNGLKAFGESIGEEHRFIVLLRDPVDRLNSYINHVKNADNHQDALIAADDEPCYAESLELWLQAFPRERFLFLKSEELYSHPQLALDKVFEFAGVGNRKYSQQELRYQPQKPIVHRPSMEVRKQYHSAYGRPKCLQRLKRLTGLEFDWDNSEFAQPSSQSRPQAKNCQKLVKPTAFFIGFGHSGTTKLGNMMNQHPELGFGKSEEHYFWCSEEPPRALETYYAEFLVPCTTKVAFDGCPILYEMKNPKARRCQFRGIDGLRAFKATLGDTDYKFIFLVRNPADWMHSHLPSLEVLPLRHQFWDPCYADFVEPYLQVFPRERFLFLRSEDLFRDAQSSLNQVFDFLQVGPHMYSQKTAENKVNEHHSTRISPEEKQRFLSDPRMVECKARLEALTGMHFDWGVGG